MDNQNETVIAINNHRNAGRAHWLIMPKGGPATRHIRDIEVLTSDDLPLRTHCYIPDAIGGFQSTGRLKSRSQRNERSKRDSSKRSFPQCPSLLNPLWLPSWSSTPYRTDYSTGHCVNPSYPLACHYRAKSRFEHFQVSRLVSAYVDLG